MTLLGDLRLEGRRAQVGLRGLLHSALLELALDEVFVGRVCAAMTEMVDELSDGDESSVRVRVAVTRPAAGPGHQLALLVEGPVGLGDASRVPALLGGVHVRAVGGSTRATVALSIQSWGPAPTEASLRRAADVLQRPSRAQLMAELRTQNRELEDRQSKLEAAVAEADRANQAKSEFLASMSHELRTPMNSILGFTRRLIRRLDGKIGERELDALHTVDRNSRHLLTLINDILDLSKIEAGRMDLHLGRVDVGQVIQDVLVQCEPLLEGREHHFVVEIEAGDLTLQADATKLRQVVTNLVSNAVKYSEGGAVVVSAGRVAHDELGEAVWFSVADQGEGIPEAAREQLFQRYNRLATEATRREMGTGLGLALCAQYVRMHGGRIGVDSAAEGGARFRVVLPRRPRDGAPALPEVSDRPAAPVDAPRAARPWVLCVDDDPDVLEFLRLTFRDADIKVRVTGSLAQARRLIRSRKPDLVCLDLSLAGDDGRALLDGMQADAALADVPVVVVSGQDRQIELAAAGARRYLRKPVSADDLIESALTLLGERVERVLVVEDSEDMRQMLVARFAELGIPAVAAANGVEALARLESHTPSIIVMDLMMPIMNGFTLLERLSADERWRGIPALVLTGLDLSAVQVEKLAAYGAVIRQKGGSADPIGEALNLALRTPT